MKNKEFIELIKNYNEWEDDLDETACPTGWVTCPVCGGGGNRKKHLPKHKPDCLRAKFEKEHGNEVK